MAKPDIDPAIGMLLSELKQLRSEEEREGNVDAAAHRALVLASMLFDIVAGWARDHVIGRTVQGIPSRPYTPGTRRERELGDDGPWDDPGLQKIGSDYEFDDPSINKRLIIELLRPTHRVLGHKLSYELSQAFEGLLFGQQYQLVKPEPVRLTRPGHELWHLRFKAICHVHFLMGTGLKKGEAQEKVADAYRLNDSPSVSGRETLTKWEQRLTDRFDAAVIKDALEGAFNRGTWFKAWSESSTLGDFELDEFADLSKRFGPEALSRDGESFANLSPGSSKAREP